MTGHSRSKAMLALVVAALFVTPAAAMALPGQQSTPAQANATNASVQAGAQFAGVAGVQGAEIDGAVEGRAFGQAVAAAQGNTSKAAVVVDRVERLQTRLTDLQQQREALRTSLQNGNIDQGQYDARITSVAARIQVVERQLNRTQTTATALPAQARASAGLNVSTIETLRGQASEMRGGEVAEAARRVAGQGIGRGIPDAPGGGPPAGVPGNGTAGPGNGGNGPGNGQNGGNGGPPDDAGQSGERGGQSDERGNTTRGNSGT